MSTQRPLRVLVGGDHEFLRRSLALLMSRRGGFEVVGEAATAEEARDLAVELQPDVAVLDLQLRAASEVEALREIRSQDPQVRVLILTASADDQAVINAVMVGASGYLPRYAGSYDLVDAVRKVGRGRSLINRAIANRVLERLCGGSQEDRQRDFTDLERQILRLVADGKSDREIAAVVYGEERVIKDEVVVILSKLEVTRRSQANRYLVQWRARRGIAASAWKCPPEMPG